MPTFYFSVCGERDDHGYELPSLAAAKCEAVRYAGKLICDSADRFWDSADLTMEVSDETELVLFRLSFCGVDAPVIGGPT